MDQIEILKHILPKEFVEHFDLTDIKQIEGQLVFCLDEKKVFPPEHTDKPLENKGFVPATQITDFPIRDKRVILIVRRRKWRDLNTGKTYTRDFDIKAKGTSYTKEFAAFLKGIPG